MKQVLTEDARDLLAELCEAQVRFVVVGGHALAVHGVSRATVDFDVFVEPEPENAGRVMQALEAFVTIDLRESSLMGYSASGFPAETVAHANIPNKATQVVFRSAFLRSSVLWKAAQIPEDVEPRCPTTFDQSCGIILKRISGSSLARGSGCCCSLAH